MESPKVNINVIARMAGVSTTTVSNFINRTETIPISAEKKARMMEAMRQTNYRPSAASSSLRRNSALPGKAVFIFGSNPSSSPFNTVRNPMLGELVSALDLELKKKLGLALEIRSVADEDSVEAWNETIADAEALVCYGRLDSQLLELSTRRNIPLALIADRKDVHTRGFEADPSQLDYVYWDAASHLEKTLESLSEKGARAFAFVSSWNVKENNPKGYAVEAEAKIAEFKSFLANAKLKGGLFTPSKPERISIFNEARNAYELLKSVELKAYDAVFGHNDFVAEGICWALRDQGLMPGRDVMVCGEGDYEECRDLAPTITTISYDKEFLAERVREILGRRLKDNRPLGEAIPAPSRLIERESSRRIAP